MKELIRNTGRTHRHFIGFIANEFDWDEYTLMWIAFVKGVVLTLGVVWLAT
jgi:hypothetical protein